MRKKRLQKHRKTKSLEFSEFIADPLISLALLVFALIALFLSIAEFNQVILFY